MTVLDAYAIIAALRDEPARTEVEALLHDASSPNTLSAANLAEVHDQLIRNAGREPQVVAEALDLLVMGGLRIQSVQASTGRIAGEMRAAHYHRDRCAVSLADCIAAATAVQLGEPLATSDPHLAALARAEAVSVVALPDTSGARP